MNYKNSLTGFERDDHDDLWLWDDVPEIEIEMRYKVKALLHYEQSPFQELSIVDTKGFGKMLVIDGTPQVTEKDGFIYNEMVSHIPIVTHPSPKKVAMIGGGDCGPAREASKYKEIEQIDVVEIDQRVVDICRTWLTNVAANDHDKRIQIIIEDGSQWIREQNGKYDVLIVDRSDPYGPAAILYKRKFYEHIFNSLTEDGVAVLQSGSPYYYSSILKNTVRNLVQFFPIVRTFLITMPSFPGGIWSFTLASKKWDPLHADLNRLQCEYTQYINPDIFRSSFVLPNYVKEILK